MAPALRAFDLLCAVYSFGSVRPKKLLKAFSDEDFRTFYIMWMERGLELQVCRKSTRQRRPIRAVRVPPTHAALASQAAIRSTGAVRPLGRGPFPSAEPYGILRNFPIDLPEALRGERPVRRTVGGIGGRCALFAWRARSGNGSSGRARAADVWRSSISVHAHCATYHPRVAVDSAPPALLSVCGSSIRSCHAPSTQRLWCMCASMRTSAHGS